jgi:hypothetical protein
MATVDEAAAVQSGHDHDTEKASGTTAAGPGEARDREKSDGTNGDVAPGTRDTEPRRTITGLRVSSTQYLNRFDSADPRHFFSGLSSSRPLCPPYVLRIPKFF